MQPDVCLPLVQRMQSVAASKLFFNKTYKNDKDTALHLAVRGNHVDVVAQILEADPGY